MYLVDKSLLLYRELNVASSTITDPGLRHLISTKQVHGVPLDDLNLTSDEDRVDPFLRFLSASIQLK